MRIMQSYTYNSSFSQNVGNSYKISQKSLPPNISEFIDLHVECANVPFSDLSKMGDGEPSSKIRERVIKARNIQEKRHLDCKGVYCNAQMTERMIHQFAEPDEKSLLKSTVTTYCRSHRLQKP